MIEQISIDTDVKALIFDCDGTLVDSMPLHMKAWKEAFKTLNQKFEKDFLYSAKGMKETEIIDLYNQKYRRDIDPDEVVLLKHEFFYDHIESVKPIEPVVDIAKSFYGKLPLGVVSGSVEKIVHKELKVIGIFHLFINILTADDPFKPKPAPDIFIASAKNLNTEPEDCLVFEDGDAGLKAAEIAGMKTIDIREYLEIN